MKLTLETLHTKIPVCILTTLDLASVWMCYKQVREIPPFWPCTKVTICRDNSPPPWPAKPCLETRKLPAAVLAVEVTPPTACLGECDVTCNVTSDADTYTIENDVGERRKPCLGREGRRRGHGRVELELRHGARAPGWTAVWVGGLRRGANGRGIYQRSLTALRRRGVGDGGNGEGEAKVDARRAGGGGRRVRDIFLIRGGRFGP